MVYSSMTEMIGNTPMLEIARFSREAGLPSALFAKLERANPAGSAKDRAALNMIEDAEEQGRLRPGDTLIEPTSGNTGVALAAIAACKGYHVLLTMPENMSPERQALLKAYGAELVLTDAALGMRGAIARANELLEERPGAVMLGQFDNHANAGAHVKTTGPEIFRQMDGNVDCFVACVGSGGTITGAGTYLKEQNSNLHVVAVEPKDSPVLSGGQAGAHKLQGIGAGFVPSILDTGIYDEIIPVANEDAFDMGRLIAKTEGVLVGISAGAALFAAVAFCKRPENAGKRIVVLLPDTGERYLSSQMFS